MKFAPHSPDTRRVTRVAELKASVEAAISLMLEEHQDWHMLVRPHHLPLA